MIFMYCRRSQAVSICIKKYIYVKLSSQNHLCCIPLIHVHILWSNPYTWLLCGGSLARGANGLPSLNHFVTYHNIEALSLLSRPFTWSMLGNEGVRLMYILRDKPKCCNLILITVPARPIVYTTKYIAVSLLVFCQ